MARPLSFIRMLRGARQRHTTPRRHEARQTRIDPIERLTHDESWLTSITVNYFSTHRRWYKPLGRLIGAAILVVAGAVIVPWIGELATDGAEAELLTKAHYSAFEYFALELPTYIQFFGLYVTLLTLIQAIHVFGEKRGQHTFAALSSATEQLLRTHRFRRAGTGKGRPEDTEFTDLDSATTIVAETVELNGSAVPSIADDVSAVTLLHVVEVFGRIFMPFAAVCGMLGAVNWTNVSAHHSLATGFVAHVFIVFGTYVMSYYMPSALTEFGTSLNAPAELARKIPEWSAVIGTAAAIAPRNSGKPAWSALQASNRSLRPARIRALIESRDSLASKFALAIMGAALIGGLYWLLGLRHGSDHTDATAISGLTLLVLCAAAKLFRSLRTPNRWAQSVLADAHSRVWNAEPEDSRTAAPGSAVSGSATTWLRSAVSWAVLVALLVLAAVMSAAYLFIVDLQPSTATLFFALCALMWVYVDSFVTWTQMADLRYAITKEIETAYRNLEQIIASAEREIERRAS